MLPLFTLAIFLLFDASPSLDVSYYQCEAYERHMRRIPCPRDQEPPCYGMSEPGILVCDVQALPPGAGADFSATTRDIRDLPPGYVIYGCVRAFDFSGNASDCVAGGAP